MGLIEDMQARAKKSLEDRTQGNKAVIANTKATTPNVPRSNGTLRSSPPRSVPASDGRKLDSDSRFASGSKLQLTIELNTDLGGIELIFSDKPIQMVLDLLKAEGFKWNTVTKRWWIKDSDIARAFLTKRFGASFDDSTAIPPLVIPPVPESRPTMPVMTVRDPVVAGFIDPSGSLQSAGLVRTDYSGVSSSERDSLRSSAVSVSAPDTGDKTDQELTEDYKVFRRQVDELIEELKIPPADLMLRAIDCLYRMTIGAN